MCNAVGGSCDLVDDAVDPLQRSFESEALYVLLLHFYVQKKTMTSVAQKILAMHLERPVTRTGPGSQLAIS